MRKKGRGGIVKVGSLFDVYKIRLKAPQKTVIKEFEEVIYDLFKMHVPLTKCTYSPHTKTLSIAVSGPLKSEVQLRKAEILAHLKGRLGEKSAPTDIV